MMFPLVRDLAADGISVAVTCRVLGFSRQAFYKWNTDPVSRRDWDDAHLINAALDIHAGDPEFGYRFIADELPAHGIVAGENRVHRLCSQQRIFSVFAKKRGLHRRSGPPVHDDLVRRQFSAQRPDRLWLTDIPPSTTCREVPPPSTGPMRASSTSARSRTASPPGSSAIRSPTG